MALDPNDELLLAKTKGREVDLASLAEALIDGSEMCLVNTEVVLTDGNSKDCEILSPDPRRLSLKEDFLITADDEPWPWPASE